MRTGKQSRRGWEIRRSAGAQMRKVLCFVKCRAYRGILVVQSTGGTVVVQLGGAVVVQMAPWLFHKKGIAIVQAGETWCLVQWEDTSRLFNQ